MDAEIYNLLSFSLELVAAIVIAATLWVCYGQLRSMNRTTDTNNLLSIVNFLQSDNVRNARATVRSKLRDKPLEHWSEEEKRDASTTCASYDVASVLVLESELCNADAILSNWGPSIIDCYQILKPYIGHMQTTGRNGPHYWDNFGLLADAAERNLAQKSIKPPPVS